MGTSWLIYRWPPHPAPISICILWSFSRSTWVSAAPAGGQKAQHWPVWQGSEHQLQLFCIPVLQRILISKWHCHLKYAQCKTGTSAEGFNEKHCSVAASPNSSISTTAFTKQLCLSPSFINNSQKPTNIVLNLKINLERKGGGEQRNQRTAFVLEQCGFVLPFFFARFELNLSLGCGSQILLPRSLSSFCRQSMKMTI